MEETVKQLVIPFFRSRLRSLVVVFHRVRKRIALAVKFRVRSEHTAQSVTGEHTNEPDGSSRKPIRTGRHSGKQQRC